MRISNLEFPLDSCSYTVAAPKGVTWLQPYKVNKGNELYPRWDIVVPYLTKHDEDWEEVFIIIATQDRLEHFNDYLEKRAKFLGTVFPRNIPYYIFLSKR